MTTHTVEVACELGIRQDFHSNTRYLQIKDMLPGLISRETHLKSLKAFKIIQCLHCSQKSLLSVCQLAG